MPGVRTTVEQPDILLLEGLNVLQPAPRHADGKSGLAVSDFFDFSVYVDAAADDIRSWYVHRFLKLWETAFRNPESYFVRYGELSRQRGDRQGRVALGRHQRAEPAREHPPDPLPRHPGPPQRRRPRRPLGPAAQALTNP